MVYILRLIPVYTSVDVPFRLQFTDALAVRSFHPPHCRPATDLFAAVFGYAAAFQKTDRSETTETVNRRLRNGQIAQLPELQR